MLFEVRQQFDDAAASGRGYELSDGSQLREEDRRAEYVYRELPAAKLRSAPNVGKT